MKVKWTLMMLALIVVVSAGLIGCEKKQAAPESTADQAIDKTAETVEQAPATPPAEKPATDKPKDHPAH